MGVFGLSAARLGRAYGHIETARPRVSCPRGRARRGTPEESGRVRPEQIDRYLKHAGEPAEPLQAA